MVSVSDVALSVGESFGVAARVIGACYIKFNASVELLFIHMRPLEHNSLPSFTRLFLHCRVPREARRLPSRMSGQA